MIETGDSADEPYFNLGSSSACREERPSDR